MAKRPEAGDVVEIKWRDACSTSGWQDGDEIDGVPQPICTVGILHSQTVSAFTVALSVDGNGMVHSTMTVPRVNITSVRVL